MVKKLIAELGLRYRPGNQQDLEAHTHALALLTIDVADVPEAALTYAVSEWARTKPFMPKASELIALARDHIESKYAPKNVQSAQAFCDSRNAGLRHPRDKEIEWFVDRNGDPKLRWIRERRDESQPICTPEEAHEIINASPVLRRLFGVK